MNIEEFKQQRVEGREQLLRKIVDTFTSLQPVAIHQFGSGTRGFQDEFSDIDIWITFKDNEIAFVLKELPQILRGIAPVLLRHYSKSWSPVDGSANSVIHETEYGVFVVDYYLSKLSETVIKDDSLVLYGDDSLERGEWKLNKEVNESVHDSHTLKKDIDLLIDLLCISVKGIVREWDDDVFVNTLQKVHEALREKYDTGIKRRRIRLTFTSHRRLLSDLYQIANKRQKRAIDKIRQYINQVESLY
jgi:predicted nucleotidyltransferase